MHGYSFVKLSSGSPEVQRPRIVDTRTGLDNTRPHAIGLRGSGVKYIVIPVAARVKHAITFRA